MDEYIIDVRRDSDAHVRVATSNSVPGLAVEADSCEEIVEIVKDALPDLFRDNSLEYQGEEISVVFNTRVE